MPIPDALPKLYRTQTDAGVRVVGHPKSVDAAVRCPVKKCRTLLVHTVGGWVCPKNLTHTRIIPDSIKREEIASKLKGDASKTAHRVFRILRGRARWFYRADIRETDVAPPL